MIDVGEALAHELALAAIGRNGKVGRDGFLWDQLPFRKLIPDPFDLRTYPLMLSISTLTIRHSRADSTFLMLRRGTGKVAIAGGMLSVMPTGVFQPASIMPTHDTSDFDMWHNMMREYSEEFLGNPEHDGDGDPIDYARQEPFRSLDAARKAGKIRIFCLGVGMDSLNFVSDVSRSQFSTQISMMKYSTTSLNPTRRASSPMTVRASHVSPLTARRLTACSLPSQWPPAERLASHSLYSTASPY